MNVVVVCNKLNKKTMKEYLPSKKHNINVLGIIISVKIKTNSFAKSQRFIILTPCSG